MAYALCRFDDIPDRQAKGFRLLRTEADGRERPWSIFVLRWGQKAYGYVNSCPHLGVSLDWQPDRFFDIGGTQLLCATHGALFEPKTGLCTQGPCRGQSLEKVDVAVIDGDVCLTQAETDENGTEAGTQS